MCIVDGWSEEVFGKLYDPQGLGLIDRAHSMDLGCLCYQCYQCYQ